MIVDRLFVEREGIATNYDWTPMFFVGASVFTVLSFGGAFRVVVVSFIVLFRRFCGHYVLCLISGPIDRGKVASDVFISTLTI